MEFRSNCNFFTFCLSTLSDSINMALNATSVGSDAFNYFKSLMRMINEHVCSPLCEEQVQIFSCGAIEACLKYVAGEQKDTVSQKRFIYQKFEHVQEILCLSASNNSNFSDDKTQSSTTVSDSSIHFTVTPAPSRVLQICKIMPKSSHHQGNSLLRQTTSEMDQNGQFKKAEFTVKPKVNLLAVGLRKPGRPEKKETIFPYIAYQLIQVVGSSFGKGELIATFKPLDDEVDNRDVIDMSVPQRDNYILSSYKDMKIKEVIVMSVCDDSNYKVMSKKWGAIYRDFRYQNVASLIGLDKDYDAMEFSEIKARSNEWARNVSRSYVERKMAEELEELDEVESKSKKTLKTLKEKYLPKELREKLARRANGNDGEIKAKRKRLIIDSPNEQ